MRRLRRTAAIRPFLRPGEWLCLTLCRPTAKSAKVIQVAAGLGTALRRRFAMKPRRIGKTLSDGRHRDLTTMLLSGLQDEFGWSVDETLWSTGRRDYQLTLTILRANDSKAAP